MIKRFLENRKVKIEKKAIMEILSSNPEKFVSRKTLIKIINPLVTDNTQITIMAIMQLQNENKIIAKLINGVRISYKKA